MQNFSKIITLKNGYHLWSHTQGKGNSIKIITVHGGPGETNEVFENFDNYLVPNDIEVTRYDQLGSYYSDQPDFSEPSIAKKFLNIDYFVNELEEVRSNLNYEKFILVGHSWGAMIAQEYALRFQDKLKGLVIISMTSKDSDYTDSLIKLREQILTPEENKYVIDQINKEAFNDEKYQELISKMFTSYFYQYDVPRVKHLVDTSNHQLAFYMQGQNPFKTTGPLAGWNIEKQVSKIKVPTYLSFGEQDLFPKEKIDLIHHNITNSELSITPGGTHVHIREFPEFFFDNLIKWIRKNIS
ncbi:MAG: proline iminopeptidase-family hydrolase [Lactobacillaceae bacterium]|jgi:proline iminopeptidase|nr:proline iminopeptidase-family hydrolase [Lactobacillaceae bacterium]